MRTEDQLSGALRDAADRAPELDLLAGVGARRRRRTRRRAQLLAAAAVVGVVSTSTVVAQGAFSSGGGGEAAVKPTRLPVRTVTPSPRPAKTSRPHPGPTVTVTPTPLERQVKGTPVGKLWPEAVFQMPAKNADGWRYLPITGISATAVLLTAESSVEKAGKIEVYDTRTGKSRVVTEIPATPGLKQSIQQAVSTDGANVVWCTTAWKDGTPVAELWQAPLSGGKAKLAATLTGDEAAVDKVGVTGQSIVWSMTKGGVYRVPFTGGTPDRVPMGDGLHLINWPWAGDAGEEFAEPARNRNQSKISNLVKGTVTRIATKDGMKNLRCGPVWCRGYRGHTGFIQRLDGTGVREPGFGKALWGYPILDRFIQSGFGVYDLSTGKVARLGESGSWAGVGISSEPSTILYWGTTKGTNPDKWWVLNLAAVPPAQ